MTVKYGIYFYCSCQQGGDIPPCGFEWGVETLVIYAVLSMFKPDNMLLKWIMYFVADAQLVKLFNLKVTNEFSNFSGIQY